MPTIHAETTNDRPSAQAGDERRRARQRTLLGAPELAADRPSRRLVALRTLDITDLAAALPNPLLSRDAGDWLANA